MELARGKSYPTTKKVVLPKEALLETTKTGNKQLLDLSPVSSKKQKHQPRLQQRKYNLEPKPEDYPNTPATATLTVLNCLPSRDPPYQTKTLAEETRPDCPHISDFLRK